MFKIDSNQVIKMSKGDNIKFPLFSKSKYNIIQKNANVNRKFTNLSKW